MYDLDGARRQRQCILSSSRKVVLTSCEDVLPVNMQTLTEQEERHLKRKLQALHLSADDWLFRELGERAGVPYTVDAQGMNNSTAESVGTLMKDAENLVCGLLSGCMQRMRFNHAMLGMSGLSTHQLA